MSVRIDQTIDRRVVSDSDLHVLDLIAKVKQAGLALNEAIRAEADARDALRSANSNTQQLAGDMQAYEHELMKLIVPEPF